jgi:hypothetical protein
LNRLVSNMASIVAAAVIENLLKLLTIKDGIGNMQKAIGGLGAKMHYSDQYIYRLQNCLLVVSGLPPTDNRFKAA